MYLCQLVQYSETSEPSITEQCSQSDPNTGSVWAAIVALMQHAIAMFTDGLSLCSCSTNSLTMQLEALVLHTQGSRQTGGTFHYGSQAPAEASSPSTGRARSPQKIMMRQRKRH